ncbi:hypothetical protein [Pedobacter frigoris]|uniref:Uncharacterized protein n=1 Tax=Pedobacter frigoris TaxID=2571272 RepID=A0A4V5NYP2_9SPHI|nr:hypothetical protein [Pedobacter frigoris]TKC04909.1 hypothetical protein FA047_14150 [Pedobacter frigoris]
MNKLAVSDNASRKYKINEYLLKLPISDYRAAIRLIPKYMRISLNTFHNYRNILLADRQDIPHEKVVMFEKIFDLKPGELLNKIVRSKTLKELLNKERDNFSGRAMNR